MQYSSFLFIIYILLLPINASAIIYYSDGIDFWRSNNAGSTKKESPKESHEDAEFWKQQSDPANDEFFREGDYIPPKPVLRVIRNPTDQNIREWQAYNEKRAKLLSILVDKMTEYEAKNSKKMKPEEKSVFRNKINSVPTLAKDRNRFLFRFYFDSNCPHCKRMFDTIRSLQEAGYYVDARRIDSRKIEPSVVPFTFRQADTAEIKRFKVDAVPVLFVADSKKKEQFRINGYQPFQSVVQALQSR